MRISLTKYGGIIPFPGGKKFSYDSSTASPDKKRAVEQLIDTIDLDKLTAPNAPEVRDANSYHLRIEKDNGESIEREFGQGAVTDDLDKLMQLIADN